MFKINNLNRAIPILVLTLILGLIAPGISFANYSNNNKDKDRDNKIEMRSHGRWSFNASWCSFLPPGIAKRFDECLKNPPQDSRDPVINAISFGDINERDAVIRWSTNEATIGRVYADTASGFKIDAADIKSRDSGYAMKHEITLSGLAPNTRYYIRIESVDRAGNDSVSAQKSFRTDADNDNTSDPEISNVQVRDIGAHSAVITWTTDEPATSQVWYNNRARLINLSSDSEKKSEYVTDHRVAIDGLDENTEYAFSVQSVDQDGNVASSDRSTFRTISEDDDNNNDDPLLMNISVQSDLSSRMTHVRWTTDEAADSTVRYSTERNLSGAAAVHGSAFVRSHDLIIPDLKFNVQYYFQIESSDRDGNSTESNTYALYLAN